MKLHSVVGVCCQSTLPPNSLTHMYRYTHIQVLMHMYTQLNMHPCKHLPTNTQHKHVHRRTNEHSALWVLLTKPAPSISLSLIFLSLGFTEIVCSFNVSPPDRKDLNSPPVHTNKRARILLTACRSALPFMSAS